MQAVYLFEKLVVLAEAYKSVFHIAYCGATGGHFFRWRKMEGAKKNIVDRMLIGTNVLLDYLLPLTQAVSCQDIDDVEQDKLVS